MDFAERQNKKPARHLCNHILLSFMRNHEAWMQWGLHRLGLRESTARKGVRTKSHKLSGNIQRGTLGWSHSVSPLIKPENVHHCFISANSRVGVTRTAG